MAKNILDTLSFGKIVQIRERLLKTQAEGHKVYRLESGDPSFSISETALTALKQAAEKGKTHYIPNAGIPELRRALREKLKTKNGIDVKSEEHIYVTNGAMHALYATFTVLLDEGDEVIVPDPMWTEVVENIKLARGVPVGVHLLASDNYEYRPEHIESHITSRTKAIFLNTPHNPTGAVLSRETLMSIIEIAKKRNLWIIADEAYEDVIYAPHKHDSVASLAGDWASHCISVFSFSKSHAMSGLRVGYLVTGDPLLGDRLQKILRCTINGVNSVAQWTALAAVTSDVSHMQSMLSEYSKRRDILYKALQGIPGLKPFYPHGAFYVWAEIEPALYQRLNVRDADHLSNMLAEQGIGSAPGDAFGHTCANAIRFAFSCETKMVEEGAAALQKVLG